MRYAWILACSFSLTASQRYDPTEVLGRVSERVRANDSAATRYTCVETVQRDFYEPANVTPPRACAVALADRRSPDGAWAMLHVLTDRLRLEVTMGAHNEIFSWFGATRFDDDFMQKVGRNGPFASGLFGALLNMIFKEGAPGTTFVKETILDGRGLLEYSFSVAQADSHYRVKTLQDDWYYTAYSGTLLVDPETADIVRIDMRTSQLPPDTGACQSAVTLDYGPQQIGGTRLLLPRQARQRFISAKGSETESVITFSSCREYSSESTVTFGEDPQPAGGPANGPSPIPFLPAGMRFLFELSAPIRIDTAAAGDPFTGKLVEAIRDAQGRTVARAGSVIEGRLLRVEIGHRSQGVLIVLSPRTLMVKGVRIKLAATRDWSRVVKKQRVKHGAAMPIVLPAQWERNSGAFAFPEDTRDIGKGFRSAWRTIQAN